MAGWFLRMQNNKSPSLFAGFMEKDKPQKAALTGEKIFAQHD
ncbi:hypothetical protein [Aristophania vespae]|nr:hypothetical protein [Aristophania vespae]